MQIMQTKVNKEIPELEGLISAFCQVHYKVELFSQIWQEIDQKALKLARRLLEILIYNLLFMMKLGLSVYCVLWY